MSFISKIFRVLSVSALVTVFAAVAIADTIRLKDGSTIKGKILSFSNGQFVILIGTGDRQRQLRFFADEIDSIEFDSSSPKQIGASNTDGDNPNYSTRTEGDTTIITVGSASKTPNPQTKPDMIPTSSSSSSSSDPVPPSNPEVNNPPTNDTTTEPTNDAVKPIQIKVKVLADNTANGWTNAGWVVKKGQRIRITGAGRISLGDGRFSSPKGISTLPDQNKLIADKPTGGLIAVIGDDNNEFIFVGDTMEFVAERDGALFLGVNEGNLDDNSGSFEVTVEIDANTGS